MDAEKAAKDAQRKLEASEKRIKTLVTTFERGLRKELNMANHDNYIRSYSEQLLDTIDNMGNYLP